MELPDFTKPKLIALNVTNLPEFANSIMKAIEEENAATYVILKELYYGRIEFYIKNVAYVMALCDAIQEKLDIEIDWNSLNVDAEGRAKKIWEDVQLRILANSKDSDVAKKINDIFKKESGSSEGK